MTCDRLYSYPGTNQLQKKDYNPHLEFEGTVLVTICFIHMRVTKLSAVEWTAGPPQIFNKCVRSCFDQTWVCLKLPIIRLAEIWLFCPRNCRLSFLPRFESYKRGLRYQVNCQTFSVCRSPVQKCSGQISEDLCLLWDELLGFHFCRIWKLQSWNWIRQFTSNDLEKSVKLDPVALTRKRYVKKTVLQTNMCLIRFELDVKKSRSTQLCMANPSLATNAIVE